MKIISSYASHYSDYTTLNHGKKKFAVHYNYGGDSLRFNCQVTEIHPYDDAEYTWAKMGSNKQVLFIRDGKIQDKMQLYQYDPDGYESEDEYINDILDDICLELVNQNKDVKPIMIHN